MDVCVCKRRASLVFCRENCTIPLTFSSVTARPLYKRFRQWMDGYTCSHEKSLRQVSRHNDSFLVLRINDYSMSTYSFNCEGGFYFGIGIVARGRDWTNLMVAGLLALIGMAARLEWWWWRPKLGMPMVRHIMAQSLNLKLLSVRKLWPITIKIQMYIWPL